MKIRTFFGVTSTLILLLSALGTVPAAASGGGFTRQIPSAGTTSFPAAIAGADTGIQNPEFASAASGDTADAGSNSDNFHGVNRSFSSPTTGNGRTVNPHKQAKSNPGLNLSMDGLFFRQQRLANGGN